MRLSDEVFAHVLAQEIIRAMGQIPLPQLERTVDSTALDALEKIKAVVDDQTLSDPDCFRKIEDIVQILERIGSSGGSRHDF